MTLISNTSSTKKNVLNIEIAGNGFAHHQLKSNRMERESDPRWITFFQIWWTRWVTLVDTKRPPAKA